MADGAAVLFLEVDLFPSVSSKANELGRLTTSETLPFKVSFGPFDWASARRQDRRR